jgi:hypothetical protein
MGTNITNGTQWTFLDMNLTDLCNATNVTNAHCNATNATDVSFRDRCNPPGGSSGGVDVQALIGIFLAALSALISSVALVIMKRSADVEVGLPLCKRWRWWLGFVINTGSELTLSTVALTLAPLAIIAPVFGTQVIFSAMIARAGCVPGVKEMMSLCEWICLAGAIAGIALCSAFGPSSETAILYEEYQIYLLQGRYLGFLVPAVTLVFCWSLILTNKRLTWLRPKDDSLTTAVVSSLGAGIAGSCSIVSSRIFTTALIWELIVGGNTKVLGMWVSWLGVFGLIASAPTQLWLLNSALASGKAAFTVPLYTVMSTRARTPRTPRTRRAHATRAALHSSVQMMLTSRSAPRTRSHRVQHRARRHALRRVRMPCRPAGANRRLLGRIGPRARQRGGALDAAGGQEDQISRSRIECGS